MSAKTPAQRRTAMQLFGVLFTIGATNLVAAMVMVTTRRWLMALVFFSLYALFKAVLVLFRDSAELFDEDAFGNPRGRGW